MPVTKRLISHNNTFVVGHNRFATTGSINDTNAHPFSHGDITLFHNGTLNSHNLLNKENYTVDSEAITANFSKSLNIKESLESLKGAYSLVWYDDALQTLNFARNKERPMYFATIKGSKSTFFASEKGMLEWLLIRNDIDYESITSTKEGVHIAIKTIGDDDVFINKFSPHTHDTYDYSNYYSTKKVVLLPKKEEAKDKGFLLKQGNISVIAKKFVAYQNGNNYGYISCTYLGEDINVTGINRNEAESLLDKLIDIRVTSVTSSNAYATLIGLSKKKKELVLVTTEEDEEDDELWEKQIEHYYQSLHGKSDPNIKHCKNCCETLSSISSQFNRDYCDPCYNSISECM
jgi:predicted glutamine amidotransferase